MTCIATKANDQKLHIAFIHKDFPYGGAERVTCDIANWLCMNGFEVTVLAMFIHQDRYPSGFQQRFHIHKLPIGRIKYSMKVANDVRNYIIEHKVNVIVTYRELLYMPWLKKQTGATVVYELHSCPFYEFVDIKEKEKMHLITKLLYSCGMEKLLTAFYKNKYKRVYSWADVYGVLCDGYKLKIEEILRLSKTNKICVLHNSVTMPKSIETNKKHTIIFVGRLTRRDKRVDRLLRIWQMVQPRLNGWKLEIIGSGPNENNLKKLATQLSLRNVFFEGQTNEVQPYYDKASILCLTSSFEGLPMVVAEAQANGVIPVMFESFLGAKEMVSTNLEGILIAPFNERAYAEELVLLANDNDRMKLMQNAVLDKSRQYDINKTGNDWLGMLRKLEN